MIPTYSADMDPEQFRKYGYTLIDWIVEYFSHPERYNVLAQVRPGEIREALPPSPPDKPEAIEDVIDDLTRIITPGLTHWNHPGFFAYFGTTASGPGILADLLSSTFNTNAMLWRTGPAAVELEVVVLGWLRQLLRLPEGLFGIINDTASVSTLVAIAAAREALDLGIRERGMAGRPDLPQLRLYTSDQAHSSVEKGAIVLGIGRDGVCKIPVDSEFRMRADLLEKAILDDRAAGRKPFCIVATVGTTSTTSVDPVSAIADIAARYGLWLHVDGAYAGVSGMIPGMEWVLAGVEKADSLVVNPHKWLFVPFDLSVLYCRKPEILRRAFSVVPEYLRTTEEETAINFMDYGIQLGRRFRALKLWMVIRYFGAEGLRERLQDHIELGRKFKQWVEKDPEFELLAPVLFSVICFRHIPSPYSHTMDASTDRLNIHNEKLLDAVNATGEVFLSHTKVNGKYTIRMAIGNLRTTEVHVKRAWELLQEHGRRLAKESF
jgi:aromatic-L-amino-acid/L-tryptophan decarboxylase